MVLYLLLSFLPFAFLFGLIIFFCVSYQKSLIVTVALGNCYLLLVVGPLFDAVNRYSFWLALAVAEEFAVIGWLGQMAGTLHQPRQNPPKGPDTT